MFDIDFKGSTTKVSFNAPCTGIIQRSHPKSMFRRFHSSSDMAHWVFSDQPRISYETYGTNYQPIKVLQLMVFGDNQILMEYIRECDLKEDESK